MLLPFHLIRIRCFGYGVELQNRLHRDTAIAGGYRGLTGRRIFVVMRSQADGLG